MQNRDRTMAEALDALEALLDCSSTDMAALPHVRYALARALAARSPVIDRLLERAIATGDATHAEVAQDLRARTIALRAEYSDHISFWTMARIMEDWPGYCAAALRCIAKLREQAAAERHILYPHIRGRSAAAGMPAPN